MLQIIIARKNNEKVFRGLIHKGAEIYYNNIITK